MKVIDYPKFEITTVTDLEISGLNHMRHFLGDSRIGDVCKELRRSVEPNISHHYRTERSESQRKGPEMEYQVSDTNHSHAVYLTISGKKCAEGYGLMVEIREQFWSLN